MQQDGPSAKRTRSYTTINPSSPNLDNLKIQLDDVYVNKEKNFKIFSILNSPKIEVGELLRAPFGLDNRSGNSVSVNVKKNSDLFSLLQDYDDAMLELIYANQEKMLKKKSKKRTKKNIGSFLYQPLIKRGAEDSKYDPLVKIKFDKRTLFHNIVENSSSSSKITLGKSTSKDAVKTNSELILVITLKSLLVGSDDKIYPRMIASLVGHQQQVDKPQFLLADETANAFCSHYSVIDDVSKLMINQMSNGPISKNEYCNMILGQLPIVQLPAMVCWFGYNPEYQKISLKINDPSLNDWLKSIDSTALDILAKRSKELMDQEFDAETLRENCYTAALIESEKYDNSCRLKVNGSTSVYIVDEETGEMTKTTTDLISPKCEVTILMQVSKIWAMSGKCGITLNAKSIRINRVYKESSNLFGESSFFSQQDDVDDSDNEDKMDEEQTQELI